ncbi:hypothetical protein [Undibacterium sp. Di24W]|uniref:hypothetical protein n=1 Tax=Undibacterium sp. Di24W TaxID=3413033 RepID=UPI003BEFB763
MPGIEIEANWFRSLSKDAKILFLARLAHGITIAGRNSYVAGSDDLENPSQLRRINEIQHRVLGCLLHLMDDDAYENIHLSVANCVLNQSEPELQELMFHTWREHKARF